MNEKERRLLRRAGIYERYKRKSAPKKVIDGLLAKKEREREARKKYNQIRARCRRDGIDFDLKPSDIRIPEKCPVLGIPIEFNAKDRDSTASVIRRDASKGYTRDNIVIGSYRAGRLKSDASLRELQRIIDFHRRNR